jgi:DNA-binding transcriptional LysR family regulator
MQIRRLEGLVGKPLFVRHGRGMKPTVEGEIFSTYVLNILVQAGEAAARLKGPEISSTVRIGVTEEISVTALPRALRLLRERHPNAQVNVLVDPSAALQSYWREERLDVMIGARAVMTDEPVFAWRTVLDWVCGTAYPQRPDAPLDLVLFDEPCLWRQQMLKAVKSAGYPWRVAFCSKSIAAIQAAVASGSGITVLPSDLVCLPDITGFAKRDLPLDPINVEYGVFAARRRSLVVEAFLDHMEQVVASGHHDAEDTRLGTVAPPDACRHH